MVMVDDDKIAKKKKNKEDHEEDKKAFERLAGATRYSPVHFQEKKDQAEENELIREAETKLFLHNIEVADKFHQLDLDISLEDLFGSEADDAGEEAEEENEEKKDKQEEAEEEA